ncbi:MAG: hypothetical protein ACJ75F_10770, partial [Flavisolibacter sp.]
LSFCFVSEITPACKELLQRYLFFGPILSSLSICTVFFLIHLLKKTSDKYWISDLFEMANDEGTSYYITLEDADTKMVMKSTTNSEWITFSKQRKS